MTMNMKNKVYPCYEHSEVCIAKFGLPAWYIPTSTEHNRTSILDVNEKPNLCEVCEAPLSKELETTPCSE